VKPLRRLVLLLACLAAGAAVGAWGSAWSGSAAWWLAIPVVLGIGWLFVADPTQCTPPPADEAGSASPAGKPPPR
jgi:uncharacterized membrane protein YoaK (UPF0700 family)